MAGMRAKRKNGSISYQYSGGLAAALEKAEKELKTKSESEERKLLKWQYEKAKKEYEAYERRIDDLSRFVALAQEEMKKQQSEQEE